jgi:hypothetical protein
MVRAKRRARTGCSVVYNFIYATNIDVYQKQKWNVKIAPNKIHAAAAAGDLCLSSLNVTLFIT